jgi:diguanylate cyclase (GGDEF)-like protein
MLTHTPLCDVPDAFSMPLPVNPAGRPQGEDDPAETFAPDLSEGAETGVYLALLELLDEGLIITGDEVILDANGAACRLLERDYRQIAGRPLANLFPSERAFLDARARLFIHGETRGSLRIALSGGRTQDFRFIAAARLRPGIHALIISPDPLAKPDAGKRRPQDIIWPKLAAALAQPVIVVDDRDRINAANQAALTSLGVDREELVGQSATARLGITWPAEGAAPLARLQPDDARSAASARVFTGPRPGWRLLLVSPQTGLTPPMPPTAAQVSADGALFADGEQRTDAQAMYLTSHDLLTGLPNRKLFEARFADATMRARQRRCSVAVMRVDLDGFKAVNREFGDDVGDAVLQQVARRLSAVMAPDGFAARDRSDSFLILLPDLDLACEAERCAESLRGALTQPYHSTGQDVRLTASIGIALFPQDGQALLPILDCARAALDHARRRGRDNARLYQAEADSGDVERHHFAAGLRHAVERQQLAVHFQPLVDARIDRVRAGEALLRWNHPQLGQMPFNRFIGSVRDGSLIVRLGDWILQAACQHAREWPAADRPPVLLTVNIAIEQLLQGDLVASVTRALASSGLPAERLELDLDEQVLEEDSTRIRETLHALAALGVRLAIDDFGRGLSSIPRLKRYPIRALKLNPDLVRGVGKSEENEAIVEAIASMAAMLGLEVFARGVEDDAQQAFLRALDCHLQQGPLFGAPMETSAFADYLFERI